MHGLNRLAFLVLLARLDCPVAHAMGCWKNPSTNAMALVFWPPGCNWTYAEQTRAKPCQADQASGYHSELPWSP